MKPALLLLCHRIPYPPNKGDKIRAFHLLKFLASHYRVYLGAFVDDPMDWQYVKDVEAICEECTFVELNPLRAKLKCMQGFITGEALSVPYYKSNELQKWVRSIVADHDITKAMAVSSVMAQFLSDPKLNLDNKIIDIVDIDSDKWLQYSSMKSWPLSWVYRREAKTLLQYEKFAVENFDASLFVSSPEAEMFKKKMPSDAHKVGYYNNGVDSEYFSPSEDYPLPYEEGTFPIVFTGAMDYWPNIDAVSWFVSDVLPEIRKIDTRFCFYIVGSKPSDKVVQLGVLEGVVVTGRVEDIRPYIHHAYVCIAPMRIARGVQNKVLEAMSMERPVIVSDMGLEGINAQHGTDVLIANTAKEYVSVISALRDNSYNDIGLAARRTVTKDFNWSESLPIVMELLNKVQQEKHV
jgi:sugar transferase (PEP-CTERM/EpsH1 system associated)